MKTLIEKSIIIIVLGNPKTKSEFNIDSPAEQTDPNFKSLVEVAGQSILVCFFYTEDEVQKDTYCYVNVVDSDDAQVVKTQITEELNKHLESIKEPTIATSLNNEEN